MSQSAFVHPLLSAHASRYSPHVERVTERVFLAVGFGLANTVMIVGDGGIVVVDTLESIEAAAEARDALREHCDLPVRALVYTHGHPDHVWGARAWVPEGTPIGGPNGVEIICHESVPHYVNEFANVLAPRYTLGGIYMYGALLPDGPEGFVVNGIGPRLRAGSRGYLPPTHTFATEDDIELAGIRMKLVFAPGESPDQIFVWLPDDRVVLSGDTVYRSFPNIYTIRGARFRDPRDWYHSVDKIRAFKPEHLVPCHGSAISGASEVSEVLCAYRDAIQYVFDQTIRGMNAGLAPSDLATSISLPPSLSSHPYLEQLYGQVDLCVQEIYTGLYGWFSGDGSELCAMSTQEEAAEIVALAGGLDGARTALNRSIEEGKVAWATKLATRILRTHPEATDVARIKADLLRRLAHETPNANIRNWWLTEAAVLDGTVSLTPEIGSAVARSRAAGLLEGVPVHDTVAALAVRLDPKASEGVHRSFMLTVFEKLQPHSSDSGTPATSPKDTDERKDLQGHKVSAVTVPIVVRNCVCAIEPWDLAVPDFAVQLSKATLIDLVLGELTWRAALNSGAAILTRGDSDAFLDFVALFDGWDS
ncbi:MAG: MBL fold metallo-hydrolase [Acidimicrobiales bacterium]|nr:MBL fold metallo-hydrolase [Acidimicrobiales bacterium]